MRPDGDNIQILRNAFYTNNATGTGTGNGIRAVETTDTGVDNLTVSNNTFTGHDTSAITLAPPPGNDYDNATIGDPTNGGNVSTGDNRFLTSNGLTNSVVQRNTVNNAEWYRRDVVGGSSVLNIERNVINNSGTDAMRFSGTGALEPNVDVTVQGNDITNSGAAGIRMVDEALVNGDEAEIHFNRIVGNDDTVGAIRNEENGGEIIVDATNNWWGCNDGPDIPSNSCDDMNGADIDSDPFLVFEVTANPTSVFIPADLDHHRELPEEQPGADVVRRHACSRRSRCSSTRSVSEGSRAAPRP